MEDPSEYIFVLIPNSQSSIHEHRHPSLQDFMSVSVYPSKLSLISFLATFFIK